MTTDTRIVVVIVQTTVLDVDAYHARCTTCGWETRRFDREATAVKLGKAHRCEVAS